MKKAMVAIIVFQMVLPYRLFAGGITAVIVPVKDGVSDDSTEEIANLFMEALSKNDIEVISKEKSEAVLSYYDTADSISVSDLSSEAVKLISKAKEHYYNFDSDSAYAEVSRAIELLKGESGRTLRDAYVTAAIIDRANAEGYLRSALKIDPFYAIDRKTFPPSTVDAFDRARSEMERLPTGEIRIDTDPKVCEVYINGVIRGVTPLVVSELPEGEYKILIKTNKYRPVERIAAVRSDETIKIKEKLYWASEIKKEAPIKNLLTSQDVARSEITEGVRVAEILKVSKTILIDVDEEAGGNGEVAIRMVDRKYKAGHNPIVISYDQSKDNLSQNLNLAAESLISQTKVNILSDPQKYLDPDGVGEPVLLGKRKKELTKSPAFWAVLGGVVAAGAGGAAAAVMLGGGGGDSEGAGSVNVQFK
ncbi:MAG: hypothetical protein COV46_04215 [Deltaproteobacteria bacterium CG11_big_fil_rev_8_21_14_0_20_49_13]|nr:MAG: hypothetical protein COV46_04215 [Deltaproteobacteria bacterium CG11_big_fil_rev_8_21_14_0_20_49_13]